MMINFERVDNESPHKVMIAPHLFGKNKPAFWLNPAMSMNPKSKAAAKGFAFVDEIRTRKFLAEFAVLVVHCFPGALNDLKAIVSKLEKAPEGSNS